jgi:hypothetical protein
MDLFMKKKAVLILILAKAFYHVVEEYRDFLKNLKILEECEEYIFKPKIKKNRKKSSNFPANSLDIRQSVKITGNCRVKIESW